MPSFGRIKQFSVLGVAAAVLVGVAAPKASADEVWFWACHAPDGTSLAFNHDDPPFWYHATKSGGGSLTDDGCATQGVTGSLDGTDSSSAAVMFSAPAGTKLAKVAVSRTTTGFSAPVAGDKQTFSLTTTNGDIEPPLVRSTATGDRSGDLAATDVAGTTSGGDFVQAQLACNGSCGGTGAVSFAVSRVGMQVVQQDPASAGKVQVAVGGVRSPVGGFTDPKLSPPDPNRYMALDVRATSLSGVPLYYAEAWFEGQPGPVQRGYYGNCHDLTPATPTVLDFPLGGCPATGSAIVSNVDAGAMSNGLHNLMVRVVDVLGNVKDLPAQTVEVANNPDLGTSTQSLSIGTSGVNQQAANNNNTGTNGGGVAAASSQNCNTPRLSVVLSDKPVKVTKGVPVLRTNKRYKFSGRLTCVINGKRKSAPKRARIDLLNKVGKKTSDKSGTTVADKGNFSIILAYNSSRTLIFRFTNTDNKRSQVSIKIKVEKAKKK